MSRPRKATTTPRKSRSGGPPIYTPETADARRAGDIRLRLTPERAAALRALAKARGVSLVALVSEWIDGASVLPGVSRKEHDLCFCPLPIRPAVVC